MQAFNLENVKNVYSPCYKFSLACLNKFCISVVQFNNCVKVQWPSLYLIINFAQLDIRNDKLIHDSIVTSLIF